VTRIAVLGLGNLMRSDDAVGMQAVELLSRDPRMPEQVEIIPGGSLGLALLERLRGITHLIAIDAVEAGLTPGAVFQFRGAELANVPTGKSVHLLGLRDLLDALTVLGEPPEHVTLIGVQPESTGWGTQLSPPVQAAVPDLLEQVFEVVASWTSGEVNSAVPGAVSDSFLNEAAR
jgi:hydrogenase maturation protease